MGGREKGKRRGREKGERRGREKGCNHVCVVVHEFIVTGIRHKSCV
jgi:hypothetical protein